MDSHLADAVSTSQATLIYYAGIFIVIGAVTGLMIFLGKKVYSSITRSTTHTSAFSKSLLTGYIVIAIVALLFIVAPTVFKDRTWEKKQQVCAEKAGYASPGENNSASATSESQMAYKSCLDR
jgi:amino acid permease